MESNFDKKEKVSLDSILSEIDRVEEYEIHEIIQAVICRFKQIYPNDEFVFISLPKHDFAERKRILASVIAFDEKCKNHRNQPAC